MYKQKINLQKHKIQAATQLCIECFTYVIIHSNKTLNAGKIILKMYGNIAKKDS